MASLDDVFGSDVLIVKEEIVKEEKVNLFDHLNAINFNKTPTITDDVTEKQYPTFMVRRGLSFGRDTVLAANEMNIANHVDAKLQHDFLISIIPPKKRFNKWVKADTMQSVDALKKLFGYSTQKALTALTALTDQQIKELELLIQTGGT